MNSSVSPLPPPQAETIDPGHGRIETRRIWTSTELTGYSPFPYCRQVFQIERIRQHRRGGKTIKVEREVVNGVTSRSPTKASPAQLLQYSRGHWSIENRLHYVRDVTFDEDRSQVRKGHGAQMMACLRNLVVCLLRLAGASNIAAALRALADRPHLAFRLIGL